MTKRMMGSPVNQGLVKLGELDIVKLAAHIYKKLKIPQLNVSWKSAIFATILAIIVIAT